MNPVCQCSTSRWRMPWLPCRNWLPWTEGQLPNSRVAQNVPGTEAEQPAIQRPVPQGAVAIVLLLSIAFLLAECLGKGVAAQEVDPTRESLLHFHLQRVERRAGVVAGQAGHRKLRVRGDPVFREAGASGDATAFVGDECIGIQERCESADIVSGQKRVRGGIAADRIASGNGPTHNAHAGHVQAAEQLVHERGIAARLRYTERVEDSRFKYVGFIDIGAQDQAGAIAADVARLEAGGLGETGLKANVPILNVGRTHIGVEGTDGLRTVRDRHCIQRLTQRRERERRGREVQRIAFGNERASRRPG